MLAHAEMDADLKAAKALRHRQLKEKAKIQEEESKKASAVDASKSVSISGLQCDNYDSHLRFSTATVRQLRKKRAKP